MTFHPCPEDGANRKPDTFDEIDVASELYGILKDRVPKKYWLLVTAEFNRTVKEMLEYATSTTKLPQ